MKKLLQTGIFTCFFFALIIASQPISAECVDTVTLANYITQWKANSDTFTMPMLMSKIADWKSGTGCGTTQTCSSISQYGITWTFDKEYQCGQFVNGDWWVLSPVTITSITPDFFFDGTYYHHGWEINPKPFTQGFDSRLAFLMGPRPSWFDLSAVPALPKTIYENSSVVKAISREPYDLPSCNGNSGAERACLKTASIITVVDQIPENNGANLFRPPYIGTDKYSKSWEEVHLELLPSLSKTGIQSIPDMNALASDYNKLWMDHMEHPNIQQYIHCSDYMPGYGQSYATKNAKAALRLMLNDSIEEKMPLLIGYLQMGIDAFALQKAGIKWPCDGGHGNGRLLPISFAAALFDDSEMKSTITSASLRQYGESSQVVKRSDGLVLYGDDEPAKLFGERVYWCQFSSCITGKTYADVCGYIDGGADSGAGTPIGDYINNVDGPWKYAALTSHIMPELKSLWENKYAFEFIDRYIIQGLWASPDPATPLPAGVIPPSEMGVSYGINPSTGKCVEGSGRFISSHGSKLTMSSMGDTFMNSMWNQYRTLNGQVTYCGDNACNGNETLQNCSFDCKT